MIESTKMLDVVFKSFLTGKGKIPYERYQEVKVPKDKKELLKKAFTMQVANLGYADKSINCPIQDHHDHSNGDRSPSAYYYSNSHRLFCYAYSNDKGVDVFDLAGIYFNLKTFKEQLLKVESLLVESPPTETASNMVYKALTIEDTDVIAYLNRRGFNFATAKQIGIRVWRPNNMAYIVLYADEGYPIRRCIDDSNLKRYWNLKSKPVKGYGLKKLEDVDYNCSPVFISEGIIDAKSIEFSDSRAFCVSLNSLSNLQIVVKKIKELLEAGKSIRPVILLLDNDEAGKKHSLRLKYELADLGVRIIDPQVSQSWCQYEKCKDFNEAFVQYPSEMRSFISDLIDGNLRQQP